jgi:hypothetical protein
MTKITIKYSISRTVALNEGRAEFGEATYQPTDTELAFLSLDDRKYLDTLDLSRSTFALPTGAPPTWPVIVEAIKAHRQARLDKQAAELATHETKILECLTEPDEKWFVERMDWQCGINRKSVHIYPPVYEVFNYGWGMQDPRILARIESLKPELERRQAVANEANEQARLDREAQELADAATAKQAAIENLTQWCIEHGPDHLKRAAKEGYDVVGGCVQWFAEWILLTLQFGGPAIGGTIIRINTKLWNRYSWDERKSPGQKAFELLDTITVAVQALKRPSSVTIEVKRIMLVEVEPPDDCDDAKREFTAVVVNITHPAAARRCLVIEVQ